MLRGRLTTRSLLVGVVVASALAAGCSGDDGDAEGPERDETGCPVARERVAELLGYEVVLDEGASSAACRFEPADQVGPAGSHVLIVQRAVADDGGYETLLSGVQADSTEVRLLGPDDVEGIERGWVAEVGRVVQVGFDTGSAVLQITVVDVGRSAEEAEVVALALAAAVVGVE